MKMIVRVVLALCLFGNVSAILAAERILAYDSVIEVDVDGSLNVTETIRIRAEGDKINRGIYRDFPTRYKDRYGNNVVVDFEMIGVERNGKTEPWFTERMSNGIRINTGNDAYIERPAEHVYTLRYRTTRQIGFFADHDELYWNAIGTGWDFPIDQGSVEVRLPTAVPVADMSAEGYTGPQGAKGQDYTASLPSPGIARWQLTRTLQLYEGFTTVLMFPKGVVTQPTSGERIGWFLKDNRGVLIGLVGFVFLLVYCIRRWRQVGRDPRKGVIIARYDPPEGRSPADLRFMKRRSYDTRSFTADVLSLSVAGLLRINREKKMLGKDKWSIERTDLPITGLDSPSQQALMATLFSGKSGKKKVDLADSNSLLRATQAKHTAALDSQFHPDYFKRNVGSFGIAMLIVVATGIAAFVFSGGGGIVLIIGICVLMVITAFTFGFVVEAPTPKGRALLDEIEGLKLYMSVAERAELEKMEGPGGPPPLDAKRYENLLPYAVALDVEDAWTDKFTVAVGAAAAAAATAGLTWYHGGGADSLGSLTQAVGSSFNSAISSASTPPGGSSGGGGGGSSGGGGGGGGGGGR